MVTRVERRVDVSEVLPAEAPLEVALQLFVPDEVATPNVLLFCLPGGGSKKEYWSVGPSGSSDGSFTSEMLRHGYLVAEVDWLGAGASTRPANGWDLSIEVLSAANDIVFRHLRDGLADGSVTGTPTHVDLDIGVGMSGGSAITCFQQGSIGTFSAIALLGFTVHRAFFHGAPYRPIQEMVLSAVDGYLVPSEQRDQQRAPRVSAFGLSDDFMDAMAAVRCPNPAPIPVFAMQDGLMDPLAREIAVPVFLGSGEIDITPDAGEEVMHFSSSCDVTKFIEPGTGHGRIGATLFRRLDGWIRSLDVAGDRTPA